MGERGYLEVPESPSEEERWLNGFRMGFDLAENELTGLLALVVIPNRDLKQAKRDDAVEQKLKELGEELLFEGSIGELIELASLAIEVVKEELRSHEEALGKLKALYRRADAGAISTESGSSTQASIPSSESARTSSTPSPEPTDGARGERSSVSVGAPS
jgi:hypothetical protein